VDKSNNRVITAIEILSPSNKTDGADRDAYLAKRDEYFLAQINLVEIDLLRSGLRPPLGEQTPEQFAYYLMVCRNTQFPKAGFWSFGIRDTLPEVPVPLKPEDPDCPLDLRACLDRGYEEDGPEKLTIQCLLNPHWPRPMPPGPANSLHTKLRLPTEP
jgi:hypothetical protein